MMTNLPSQNWEALSFRTLAHLAFFLTVAKLQLAPFVKSTGRFSDDTSEHMGCLYVLV
jgi:hypothetical protein